MLGQFADKLTHLAASILIQLSPPRPENSLVVETIIHFLEENNPFDSDIDKCDLISLGTGLTDRTGKCNSKTAKRFGEEFYKI